MRTLLLFLTGLTATVVTAADLPELILPQGAGVNIHFTRGHERDLDLIAAAGFKFVRYDWKNDGPDLKEREHNFGTVTQDLQPKPSYVALQTLTRELSGYRIEKRLATASTNDWVLLLSKAAEHKIAAWTVGESHAASIGGLNFKSVSSVSGDGKPAEAKLTQGSLSLTLTPLPKYVTLRN